MPLIKPLEKEETKPLSIRLDESVWTTLEKYCGFLRRPKGDVIQQMILLVTRLDKDYARSQETAANGKRKVAAG